MFILALDTTTAIGSVALSKDGRLVGCRIGDPNKTHGERLPGEILELLEDHKIRLADIDLYSVCSGPGSFTGLRVGLATIQGMALVNRKQVIAISSLEALSYAVIKSVANTNSIHFIGAWMNAHREETFSALYRFSHLDAISWKKGESCMPLTEVIRPTVGTAESIIQAWKTSTKKGQIDLIGVSPSEASFVLRELGERVSLVADTPPLAPILARIAALQGDKSAIVAPNMVRPVYIRRPAVELAREKTKRNDESS
jgi:tRNA threonylcarbamoyl adenosine modification protein YeaZ